MKSTGPRTARGKARVSLNALRHGRSAARSVQLRERLLRAGYSYQEALYGDLRSVLAQAFEARDPQSRRRIDHLATRVWCAATRREFSRTKLECALESKMTPSRVLSQGRLLPLRFRAQDPWRRIGVAFWVQHRRYLTAERLRRVLKRQERLIWPGPEEGLETGVRYLVFRMTRPGYFERLKCRLDRNGDPDWEREPWRNLPGSAREAYRREAEARARLSSRRCPTGAGSAAKRRVQARDRTNGATQPSPAKVPSPPKPAGAPPTHGLRGFVARLRLRLAKLLSPQPVASSEFEAAGVGRSTVR